MDQPYTQNQESQDSFMFFPSVFKSRGLDSLLSESKLRDQFILAPRTKLKKCHKSSSKPLKYKESLNLQELCPPHHDLCLKDLSAWLGLVTWHCHSNLLDSHMLESIRNDAKYLFDLYKDVILRGGWRNMIAFNGWPEISKNYGNMHSDELRDDYEKYLLSLELINNPTTKLDSLSNYTVLQEIQPKCFSTIPTEKLNGSLSEITEEYWNSLLEKSQVVCSGFGDIVLQVDNAQFLFERVVNVNPSRRTRPIIYQISDHTLEKQESENHISMKDFFSSTSAQSSFRVTIETNYLEKPVQYFYEKIPIFISPISGSNLLSSHTKVLTGITDPALEILQNVPFTWSAESLPLNKLILNHGPECLYVYSVDMQILAKLDSKLQEIYDITCDHSNWIPQDLFFMQHGIEVSIHGMKPGDLVISIQAILSSSRFYWIIPQGNCSFSHWCLMHLSIKRLENLLERYNFNPNKKHMMGMRLYSTIIYFLNSKLAKMPSDLKQYLLKFLHNLLADEISKYAKLSSNTPQHDVLKKSKKCRKCFKEILLLFGYCSTCQGSDNKNSYCLDCSGVIYNQRHLCKDPNIFYYSKYKYDKIKKLQSKFDQILGGSESIYKPIKEFLPVIPRSRLKYDSGNIKENILVSPEMVSKIRERALKPDMSIMSQNIDLEVPQDMQEVLESDLPAVELPTKRKRGYSSKDKNHKRVKISKKDMVKKAMENPVHEPRFGIDDGLNGNRKVKKKADELDFDKYLPSGSVKNQYTKPPSENGLSSLIKPEPKPVSNSSKPAVKLPSNSAYKQKLVAKNGFSAEKLKILVNDSIEMKELVPIPKKKK